MAASLTAGQLAGIMGGSSLLGFGGNLITSGINSARAWKYAHEAMHYQDKLNRRFTRDQYGLMREGLTKADYNPLLALNGMSASTPSSAVGIGQSDSDNGAQAITSAMDAMRVNNETKLNKAQIDKVDAETAGIKLENRQKRKELNTSPRGIVSDLIEGENTPVTNAIKKIAKKVGVNIGTMNSAVSTNNNKNIVRTIQLHENKPYVQKGVPKSVVKSFSAMSAPKYDEVGFWNNPNRRLKVEFLGDNPHHVTKYKVKSKPPKTFPSGM